MINQNNTGMAHCNVRVGPMSNIEPLLRFLGCDPISVIQAAGVTAEDLRDLDHRIPYTTATKLIDHCAKASGCDHFGLLLGQRYHLVQLGVAGELTYTANDVSTALHDLVNNFQLQDNGSILSFHRSTHYSSLKYTIIAPDVGPVNHTYDLTATCICITMRALCGVDWNPFKVELSRPEPKNTQPYKDFFRAPVLFNSPNNTVTFSNKCLNQPLATADSNYHMQLKEKAKAQLSTTPKNLSWEVRSALHRQPAFSGNSAAIIADMLALHERTLHRRLQLEGTSFRKLLDEVRKTASYYYLAGTALTIKEIALILGYSSTGAYDHAFQRWFGCPPSQWRKALDTYEPASSSN